ncbi:MAG: hypothetical protein ABJH68_02745 [Ilumatobacter sp.]|uniref:hypothetical protein n=1 Tax=Bacteria TaxID=2 RepID=UPI003298045D
MFDPDAIALAGRDDADVALCRFGCEVQTDVWRLATYRTRPEDSDGLAQEALFCVIKYFTAGNAAWR